MDALVACRCTRCLVSGIATASLDHRLDPTRHGLDETPAQVRFNGPPRPFNALPELLDRTERRAFAPLLDDGPQVLKWDSGQAIG